MAQSEGEQRVGWNDREFVVVEENGFDGSTRGVNAVHGATSTAWKREIWTIRHYICPISDPMDAPKLVIDRAKIPVWADTHWGVGAITRECSGGDGGGEICDRVNLKRGEFFFSSPLAGILHKVQEVQKEVIRHMI